MPPFLFVLSFIALAIVLTVILAWIYFYTDSFEGTIALLGLGGLLGGIATLFKAVHKDRIEETQKWLTEKSFDRHRTWIVVLSAGVMFLIGVS